MYLLEISGVIFGVRIHAEEGAEFHKMCMQHRHTIFPQTIHHFYNFSKNKKHKLIHVFENCKSKNVIIYSLGTFCMTTPIGRGWWGFPRNRCRILQIYKIMSSWWHFLQNECVLCVHVHKNKLCVQERQGCVNAGASPSLASYRYYQVPNSFPPFLKTI